MALSGFDKIRLLAELAHCRRFHEKENCDAGDVLAWIAEEFGSLSLAAALEPDSVAREKALAAIAEQRRLVEAIVGSLPETRPLRQGVLSLPAERLLPWLRDELAGLAAEAEREPNAKERARLLAQAEGLRAGVEVVVGKLPDLPRPGRVGRLRRAVSIHSARASTRTRRLFRRLRQRVEQFSNEVSTFFVRGGLV